MDVDESKQQPFSSCVLMEKTAKSTALINNVDGISDMMVKTLFETSSVAFDRRVHAHTSLTPFDFMFGEAAWRNRGEKKKKL